MWGLHWLPIRARIQYKLLLLVHKAFIGGSPPYMANMMITRNTTRSTRSSHKVNLLVAPHHGVNKYSEKAFAVAGPRLWNELLTDELRGCNSLDTFKKKLKTLLFQKHYEWPNYCISLCCYILFPIIYTPMCMVTLCMLAILCCHTIDWDIFLRYWRLSQYIIINYIYNSECVCISSCVNQQSVRCVCEVCA